jgi:hypothetical protein
MNCLEFENVVHDITRNTDVVSPWQRGLDHAQGCERCAVLLAEARAVHASLRTLAVTDGEKQAGPAVEAALRMASPRWSQWTMGAMLLAGAAAVVLAVVLSFQGSLNNRPQQPFASNDAAQPTAPVPVPGDASGAHAALTAQSAKAPAVAEVSAGANPAAAVETANASDGAFTPLPDSDDSLPLDGGAVIRVTMQKSLLASFGLQVSDDDANSTEQIAADVVVDQAGMPRAIRVVQ